MSTNTPLPREPWEGEQPRLAPPTGDAWDPPYVPSEHPENDPTQVQGRGKLALLAAGGLVLGLLIGSMIFSQPRTIEATSPTVTVTQTASASAPPSATPSPQSEVVPPPAAPAPADGVGKFGQKFTWDDGLTATVTAPVAYKPSNTAAGTEGYKQFLTVTVTLKNGSDERFDTSLMVARAQSSDEEASEVFDSEKNMGGTPYVTVLPGRSITFKQAFGVKDVKDFVYSLTPSFDHDEAIFSITGN